jgi:hypothetical protein
MDHSPKPWRLVREGRKLLVVSGRRMNREKVAEICLSPGVPWESNARLIIRAPDMHSALLKLLSADTEQKRLELEAAVLELVEELAG